MKKWNWSGFVSVLAVTALGAASNKTIPDITSWAIVTFGFGIPFGLLIAYVTRD